MTKLVCGLLLATCLLPMAALSEARQATRPPTIGWLAARPPSGPGSGPELFRAEFRKLGYVEGKNFTFEYRSANAKLSRLPALAEDLVRLKVDVIFAPGSNEILAAKNATRSIPIVFASTVDPVAAGFVDSLARPGGNITGFTRIGSDLTGKRLELLKESVVKLTRVAVLWNPQDSTSAEQWKVSQAVARELALQLHSMEVSGKDKVENAFRDAVKARSDGLAVITGPVALASRKQIADLAISNRLPAIYPREDFIESGGLMSYGADQNEAWRRVAVMIDKIFKGTRPADIPVEQPTKFEFIVNLKAANQIGLTIPPNVLARADRVIK